MRDATQPLRHSQFSDILGSGIIIIIILNNNAYSVDRLTLYTSHPEFMLQDFASTLIPRSVDNSDNICALELNLCLIRFCLYPIIRSHYYYYYY